MQFCRMFLSVFNSSLCFWLLIVCLFINHVNRRIIFVFGAFVYHFKNILRTVNQLLNGCIFLKKFLIYSNSRCRIKFPTNTISMSVLVNEYRRFLWEISDHSKVILICILRHRDIVGNCTPNRLARAGTKLTNCGMLKNINVPIA